MSQVPATPLPGAVQTKPIRFSSGVIAMLAFPTEDTPIADVVRALDLTRPCPVIVAIGSTAEMTPELAARLVQIFGRGLIAAANATDAAVVDGGTDAGIIATLGASTTSRIRTPTLVGVAPAGKVTWLPDGPDAGTASMRKLLEPHHRAFILPPGEKFGDETTTLFAAAQQIALGCPVITVLAGGGNIARAEVLQSVRRKWPVIVLEGSGRLADAIAQAKKQPSGTINDPELAEIVVDGDIRLLSVETAPSVFANSLAGWLTNDAILRDAWEQQRVYSENANRHHRFFSRLQNTILILGICVTIIALLLAYVRPFHTTFTVAGMSVVLEDVLKGLVILTPILLSVVISAASRFNNGNTWLVLRAGAEAIKRETFRYRTRTGIYNSMHLAHVALSRERQLAIMLETIGKQWIQKEGNIAALRTPRTNYPLPEPRTVNGVTDDRVSPLTAEDYIAVRLEDQRRYYRESAAKLQTRQTWFQSLALVCGGAGTFFAAVSLELVVPVVTAMATTLLAYLEYRQTANSIRQYMHAERVLADIRGWWDTLTDAQHKLAQTDMLVENTEAAIQSEMVGWVQQMQVALTELQKQQAQRGQDAAATQPIAATPPTPASDVSTPDTYTIPSQPAAENIAEAVAVNGSIPTVRNGSSAVANGAIAPSGEGANPVPPTHP